MLASAEDSVAEMIPAMIIGPQPDTNCITWTQTHNPYKHSLTPTASPGHRHTILTNTASHRANCITWTQAHNPYKHSLTPTASPGHRHTILTNTASHQLHHLDTDTQSLQTQPDTNCITWTQAHNPYKHSLTPTASPGHRHTILTNTASHQLHHLDTGTQSLQTQPDTNCITWTQTHNPYKHSLTPTTSPGHRHTILTNTASHQLHHLDTDTQSLQTQPHTNCITWTQTHNPYKHSLTPFLRRVMKSGTRITGHGYDNQPPPSTPDQLPGTSKGVCVCLNIIAPSIPLTDKTMCIVLQF